MSIGTEATGEIQETTQGVAEPASKPEVSDGTQSDTEAQEEVSGGESARDTVKRVLEESKKESDGGQDAKPEKAQKQPVEKKQATEPKKHEPPRRFSAAHKELFNKLPDELKGEVAEMVRHHESKFTKTNTEATKALNEARHVVEAVRPYLLANPQLMQRGYTESKLVTELVGTHKALTNDATKMSEWLRIGTQIGVDGDLLVEIAEALEEEGNNVGRRTERDTEYLDLQNRYHALQSEVAGLKTQVNAPTTDKLKRDFYAVRDEQNPDGSYKYPELHNDGFIQQVGPLVQSLLKTVPGLTPANALRQAYKIRIEQNGVTGDFQQQPQLGRPQNTQQNTQNTRIVRSASDSVRGRSSAPTTATNAFEVPKEHRRDPRSTVAYVLQQMRNK